MIMGRIIKKTVSSLGCIKPAPTLISALLVLAVGVLVALLGGDRSLFSVINKPAFSPPAFVFPIVWTVIYLLIGGAAGAVLGENCRAPESEKYRSLFLFTLGLLFNYLWYPLFFGAGAFLIAFIDILLMIVLTFITARIFGRIIYAAGVCLWIYLGWLCFAALLNFSILILN